MLKAVQTDKGLVQGFEKSGVRSYLGIPYAAPPTGELRWQPPAPAAAWTGIRNATEFGYSAIQTRSTNFDPGSPQSEDCLYLNVWTTAEAPDANQPVMLWIHGGGFLNGSSSLGLWSGQELCREGVTVVSCNYRLGAFGFFAHPQAGSNFAVLDWVAALEWIKDNIRAFGGDPGNVTVFGQSAGGAAVRALLCTSAARGLFHRGIIMSAGFEDYAVVDSPTYKRIREISTRACETWGSQDIAELRRLPAEQVRLASLNLSGSFPPPGQVHTPANLNWYPTADGVVMQDDFTGWPEGVPVMFGTTEDESRLFLNPGAIYAQPDTDVSQVYTQETLVNMARRLGGPKADELLAHFTTTNQTPYQALTELVTSAVWHEPALASQQRYAGLGRDAYHYNFSRVSPGNADSQMLAYHSAELPYLFATMTPPQDYTAADYQAAREMRQAWAEFARRGVPRSLDGAAWPKVNAAQPQLTDISEQIQSGPLPISTVTRLINAARAEQQTPVQFSGR